MKFVNAGADVYIPDGVDFETAMKRTNGGNLAIGAHQDDLEIFAMHGIGQSLDRSDKMFTGITVTDGGGSPRKGPYANHSDDQLIAARHLEQQNAAREGRYSAQFQLHYKSRDLKGATPIQDAALIEELYQIFLQAKPANVYLHNPFDKHETHNAITRAAITALRKLPKELQPENVYGCEVWRGLDWLPDEDKIALDVSAYIDLQKTLIACHDSQIVGSKNYIDGTVGREFQNATYGASHSIGAANAVTYAVDLKPLLNNPEATLQEFTASYVRKFSEQLLARAKTYEF